MRNLGLVNEFCTCGAKLPEDARFCHRCGKPQRDEPEIDALAAAAAGVPEASTAAGSASPDTTTSAAIPPPPFPAPPALVGFRNPAAVRAALISSALATVVSLVPFPGYFHSLWQLLSIVAGGFVSVYFYHRRTGDYLNVRAGLQLGWMTGLFCFLVIMVMFTVVLAMLAALGEAGLKDLAAQSGRPEVAEALGTMLTNPAMLVFALAFTFFFMTMLASAGGALGSKVLERE